MTALSAPIRSHSLILGYIDIKNSFLDLSLYCISSNPICLFRINTSLINHNYPTIYKFIDTSFHTSPHVLPLNSPTHFFNCFFATSFFHSHLITSILSMCDSHNTSIGRIFVIGVLNKSVRYRISLFIVLFVVLYTTIILFQYTNAYIRNDLYTKWRSFALYFIFR